MGKDTTVNADKKERYRKLVYDVNHYTPPDKSSLEDISLEAFPLCEEVNLWSYWEGGEEHLDADILLVGQDWGTLSYAGETIVGALKTSTYEKPTFCYMKDATSCTDLALCELFKEISPRYRDLRNDLNTYSELFFTNFVPWYRTGNKISGGLQSSWINASKDLFSELVDIIRPKVILCLGKAVFQGVLKSTNSDYKISGSYNKVIRCGPVKVNFNHTQTLAFPLAHCGTLGTMNRNREKKAKPSDPLALQKQDWANVKRVLDDMGVLL